MIARYQRKFNQGKEINKSKNEPHRYWRRNILYVTICAWARVHGRWFPRCSCM